MVVLHSDRVPIAKSKKSKPLEEKPVDTGASTLTSKPHNGLSESKSIEQSPNPPAASKDFESLYLQRVTAEFADDIDRLRKANDFSEESLPILIEALKQGACVYSEDEKRAMMGQQ
ncbi:MAG: hypothetical protein HETSPECPRED_004196 [Heterodermia speciosa]|uniref:Ribosome assembly protein 3 n=1 Tax=Heterodermia speciosa TaxID=116794 RepID=A0A8H3INJ0_9LECA|nr:MAG: hypothetical protein HETSPECPRED_004196 [Heterodermia speciosa]